MICFLLNLYLLNNVLGFFLYISKDVSLLFLVTILIKKNRIVAVLHIFAWCYALYSVNLEEVIFDIVRKLCLIVFETIKTVFR